MSFGLKINNSFGELLLSTENKNLHFYGRFTATVSSGIHSATFACPARPIVFMQGINGYCYAIQRLINNGNGTWTVRFVCMQTGMRVPYASSLQIYVFSVASNSTSTHGIRVYDSTGALTFEGSRRILVPAASGFNPSVYTASNVVSYVRNLDWGTIPTNWAITCASAGRVQTTGQPSFFHGVAIGRSSDTALVYSIGTFITQINQNLAGAMTVPAFMGAQFIDTSMYQ